MDVALPFKYLIFVSGIVHIPFAYFTEVSRNFFKLLAKLAESFVFIYLGLAMFTFKIVC
jgi:hypothetical protein